MKLWQGSVDRDTEDVLSASLLPLGEPLCNQTPPAGRSHACTDCDTELQESLLSFITELSACSICHPSKVV